MRSEHRRPPDPEHWDTPAGSCRWCGCCIYDKDGKPAFRRHWHKDCDEEFKFIFWPDYARRVIGNKRGWVCDDCREKAPVRRRTEWIRDQKGYPLRSYEIYASELHHIIPLVDYVHDPADPYAAWREGNLVLLCHACHQKRHAALRAEKKPQMRLAL